MNDELGNNGYAIVENIYADQEVKEILSILDSRDFQGQFGVREFLVAHPEVKEKILNKRLRSIINQISPGCSKIIKSIYFNKPPSANWIVNWHQDLTINLENRKEIESYKNWRVKGTRIIAQPNRAMLEGIFTIRIHLDDCTKQNGALRVIEKSHTRGVVNMKDWIDHKHHEKERICEVGKGGILIMKPLIIHSSRRTENDMNRRVIHLEFTSQELPIGLRWKEKIEFRNGQEPKVG